jgi:hypothetical protein
MHPRFVERALDRIPGRPVFQFDRQCKRLLKVRDEL